MTIDLNQALQGKTPTVVGNIGDLANHAVSPVAKAKAEPGYAERVAAIPSELESSAMQRGGKIYSEFAKVGQMPDLTTQVLQGVSAAGTAAEQIGGGAMDIFGAGWKVAGLDKLTEALGGALGSAENLALQKSGVLDLVSRYGKTESGKKLADALVGGVSKVKALVDENPEIVDHLKGIFNLALLREGGKQIEGARAITAPHDSGIVPPGGGRGGGGDFLSSAGKTLKNLGEQAYRISTPMEESTRIALQNYQAKAPTLLERTKGLMEEGGPRTEARTAMEKGLVGTEWQIGVKAKSAAGKLWNDIISPHLENSAERTSMPEFIDNLRKRIISENPELGRRNELLNALEAFKEEYKKVGEVSDVKLQGYKEGWAKFIPEKAYKGKPIGSQYKEIQRMAAEQARGIIYEHLNGMGKIKKFGLAPADIKQAYIDYGNLKSISEYGIKSLDPLRSKSVSRQMWEAIMDKAVTPITTAFGQVLYKTGDGLEFMGHEGAKTVRDFLKDETGSVNWGAEVGREEEISPKGEGEIPPTTDLQSASKTLLTTKSELPLEVAQNLRAAKGLSAEDIVAKYPDINLKRDVPITNIHGNKQVISEGEALTPYELKGNKVLLQDGQTYIVSKNQFQNIKGNAMSGEAKPFAPELKGTKEIIKRTPVEKINIHSKYAIPEVLKLAEKSHGNAPEALALQLANDNEAFYALKAKYPSLVNKDNWEEIVAKDVFGTTENFTETKFSQYQLPGGKDYKEILIKAPTELLEGTTVEKNPYGGYSVVKNGAFLSSGETKIQAIKNAQNQIGEFRSSHWDEPNVLAHLRLNERTAPDGGKVTFIEELQSDWAREARAGKTKATNPLLKNWQELSIKRALKEAVNNDSDYLAWTTGEQQAARYNLAKQLDYVKWKTESGGLRRVDMKVTDERIPKTFYVDEKGIVRSSDVQQFINKPISEAIGKGIGDKILTDKSGNLSGEGLNFGGEWAKNLYDKQVKNIVEDITGGKVEILDLGLKNIGQQAIKLTPEIKALVKGEAPPLKKPSNKLPMW